MDINTDFLLKVALCVLVIALVIFYTPKYMTSDWGQKVYKASSYITWPVQKVIEVLGGDEAILLK